MLALPGGALLRPPHEKHRRLEVVARLAAMALEVSRLPRNSPDQWAVLG